MKQRSLVVLALGSASLVAQQPTAVEAALKTTEPPAMMTPEMVQLSDKAPDKAPPVTCSDTLWGTHKIGGKQVLVAVGKSSADAALPDVLCIDSNGDGKIDAKESHAIKVTEQDQRGTKMQRGAPIDVEFELGGAKIAGKASFSRMGDGPAQVSMQFPTFLAGTVSIGGEERTVAVFDKDLDGRFNGADDVWILAKKGDRPAQAFALSAMGERRFDNGHLVGIKVDGNQRIQVSATKADGPDPKDQASHRVRVEHWWSDRFDKERDSFVAQRKLDTTRPLTKKPIDWQYVTFDQALELGKKAGKPVFVDVMAFWCVWCYRMDYYTYPDQEVADLLQNKFIPVKIIQEQDAGGDYDKVMKEKLEARGIPAMGIFDGDGKLLHKIGGWKAPADFVKDLQTGLEAFGK